MEIKENILLANHTTFRIGGPARYFVEALNVDEIKEAVSWARKNNVPYFILGGGSNLLVSDEGFNGLVIKVKSEKLKVKSEGENLKVEVEAGVPLIKIIMETVKNNYSGAEWGFGIPGTIGGAICGNAHRLGRSISEVVESVEVFDENLEAKILSKEECEFGYGQSRFKKTGEIILSANLIFKKEEQKIIDDVLNQGKKIMLAHPPFPSAGCVFANCLSSEIKNLLKEHPELEKRIRGGKFGVGYMIDQSALKGCQVGGAEVWGHHANYIINKANAKAKDVIGLINLVKETVRKKYNFELKEEIRFLGF
ncbi:MAG: UDP-N-acetylenolpyruvoylglucosamine reductase [Candidatus Portnoybacteria bacterium RBG_13_41_18]|uniref:UDP-N-acetylenolpyruvoylglucosamine reductase n=1 Tax=Candidatus Portnoybacteria bacterium RBG_13_41_18 TaxID=1801991 RepID=A0A1G2F6R3_9BACT|nr:MAG: UDP-N-acetylenolpyruvoylglucosamine reductase [Candidatus Portnoybacteria bacterium RBG_13_41_18]